MEWPGLIKEVQRIAKKTGQFSLNYNRDDDHWDASFFGDGTESGCCYARSAWNAVCGALQNAVDRETEQVPGSVE